MSDDASDLSVSFPRLRVVLIQARRRLERVDRFLVVFQCDADVTFAYVALDEGGIKLYAFVAILQRQIELHQFTAKKKQRKTRVRKDLFSAGNPTDNQVGECL